ncbi:MAG: hypothetical protein PHX14_03580 [Syntrophomonadaceae bacterium]|nr:hypothetical protein [Syntrophomonadaceae bacterium]
MSSFTNSVYDEKSLIITECQRANNNTKSTSKKKQIASLREGKFYCIYLIEENGQKILLSRIPIKQIKKRRVSEKTSKYTVASCGYNARLASIYKQQNYIIAAHKQNVQRIVDILNRGYGDSE